MTTSNQEYRARVQKVKAQKEARVLQAYNARDKVLDALAKRENAAAYWAGSAMACALVRALNN